MEYMHRNFEKRTDPGMLLEGAQSVICLGMNYKPVQSGGSVTDRGRKFGRIARYAQYEDYHVFIKRRLRRLVDYIGSVVGESFRFKLCVDSVPLAERALAVRAGLGFIEACPTGALLADGQFDASRCISYLTIEHKDDTAGELAAKIGDRLFGCDECVLVCPLQKNAPVCRNEEFKFYGGRERLDLDDVPAMANERFEGEFDDSPLKRLGLERLRRNARICLENIQRRL